MKIRADKLLQSLSKTLNEISYRTEEQKKYTVELNLVEADLTKGIPLSVLQMIIEYEAPERTSEPNKLTKHKWVVEVFDDMDSADPTITHTTVKTIKD